MRDRDERVRAPVNALDRDGPRAEDADLAVGDEVAVALRVDVEERGRDPLRARRLTGRVKEVRGPDSSVVAQLETGWCINAGDRVLWRRPAEGESSHG